ncbi:MAG: glycosyltransferase [Rikenellaceae bacterium]
MEIIVEYIELAARWCGWWGLGLAAALVVLYKVELCYYIFRFGRLARYRDRGQGDEAETQQSISAIVPLFTEDYSFFEHSLPMLLAQEGIQVQVIVVYVGEDKAFYEDIMSLDEAVEQVHVTRIAPNRVRGISPKLALNIGIKAARCENVIFVDSGAMPTSSLWLKSMADGFRRGDVVVGYGSWERGGGLLRSLMRLDRMLEGSLSLSSAIDGESYRSWRSCMALTRKVYFDSGGFDHLNMNYGVEDLFLQKITRRRRARVVLSPSLTIRERVWGGVDWWLDRKAMDMATFRFYPSHVRLSEEWFHLSPALALLLTLVAVVMMPLQFKIGAVAYLLLKYIIAIWALRPLSRRLGEGHVHWALPLYDAFMPLCRLYIWLKSRKRDERVWR